MRLTRPDSSQRRRENAPRPGRVGLGSCHMVRTCSVKGKNRLDFGFRQRENAILPRFWLTKGKNCAILGFQLRESYFPSALCSDLRMGGDKNMPPSVIRGLLRMAAVECGDLFTAIGHLTQPGSSQRAKGECSSPRPRGAWLLLRVTWPGHVRRIWLVRIYLAMWDSARQHEAYLLSERKESA